MAKLKFQQVYPGLRTKLVRLLVDELGFENIQVTKDYDIYKNNKDIIVLQKSLRTIHIIAIRHQLDMQGYIDKNDFDFKISGWSKNTPLDVKNTPYLTEMIITEKRKYNPAYGDERLCKCGDSYYSHFDSFNEIKPTGCRYCVCNMFEEDIDSKNEKKK